MTFSVLDRDQSVRQNILLEASAGTGKTFAIENIVARLLIESEGEALPLEKILVVTFTRAATRELKNRIRSTIEKNLSFLKQKVLSPDGCPDYLLAYIEKGEEAIDRAKRLLEQAIFLFDRAQIHTIHGFCWRMLKHFALEANISFNARSCEETSQHEIKLLRGIRDFLRTQLLMPDYSTQQLKILMKMCKRREDLLAEEILKEVAKGICVTPLPSFAQLYSTFLECVGKLPSFSEDKIVDDMLFHAGAYKGLHSRDGRVKDGFLNQVQRLASLLAKGTWSVADFDCLIEDGLFFVEAFDSSNLKVKKNSSALHQLHYPDLLKTLQITLGPIVSQARNPAAIFSRVVNDCRMFLQEYHEQQELFGHNDLLTKMRRATTLPAFAKQVRNSFSAVIVDEFQDTDPIQWEIFSNLFCGGKSEWNGFLQLVGDPKQSIYAFRQADIYTYLSAAHRLGPEAHATLDTNFRSQPPLVQALNTLFNAAYHIFPLPRLSQALPFREVKAGKVDVSVNGSPLTFLVAKCENRSLSSVEEDYFFPAIARELIQLNNMGITFNQSAVLVADRYQADRLAAYLREKSIPVRPQRGNDLSKSPVVDAMRELLDGILHYHHRSSLYAALGGRVVGITHQELRELEANQQLLPIIEQCHYLRSLLKEQGFCRFYPALMASTLFRKSILEKMLGESGGHAFYREWQDLADLLIAEERSQNLTPYGLIAFLDQLDSFARESGEVLLSHVDPDDRGVSILTTHISKGLEYDVVFALGLTKTTKASEHRLITVEDRLYAPHDKDDVLYKKYCEEQDAEKMRQLYVALTRAKLRLYVPVIIYDKPKDIQLGSASPTELLLARLGGGGNYEEIYQRIGREDGSALAALVETHPSLMTVSSLEKVNSTIHYNPKDEPVVLIPPSLISIPTVDEVIQSFTSMTTANGDKESIRDHELGLENSAPHDFLSVVKSPHTLPAGNETGVLLHKIFEFISFHSVKQYRDRCAFEEVIAPFVKHTPFEKWRDVIAHMVYDALTTPLIGSSPAFCLADVGPKCIYREMPFLYPCESHSIGFDGCTIKSGFLKGVIDLFFVHQGKYYLLDWKSNWLGNDRSHYQEANLKQTMQQHQYYLQADIYAKAMARYLKLFDKRPFEEIFGGTYYLFLRGIGPNTGVLLCQH